MNEPINEFEELLTVYETESKFFEVYPDYHPDNPLDNPNAPHFYMNHHTHDFGNIAKEYNDCSKWDDIRKRLYTDYDIVMMLPVYMFYKGGALFFSTYPYAHAWSAGQVGFIFLTEEQVYHSELKGKLEHYIKLLNDYSARDTYIVIIRDKEHFYDYTTAKIYDTNLKKFIPSKAKDLDNEYYKQLWTKKAEITRTK